MSHSFSLLESDITEEEHDGSAVQGASNDSVETSEKQIVGSTDFSLHVKLDGSTFDDDIVVLDGDDDDTHTHDFNEIADHDHTWLDFPIEKDIYLQILTDGEDSIRCRLLASVERLSGHVPQVVLYRLLDEAQTKTTYRLLGSKGSFDEDEEESDHDSDGMSKSTISELSDIDETLTAYMKLRQKPAVVVPQKISRSLGGGSFQMPGFSNENGSRARSITIGQFPPPSQSGMIRSLTSGNFRLPSQSDIDVNENSTCAQSQDSGDGSQKIPQAIESEVIGRGSPQKSVEVRQRTPLPMPNTPPLMRYLTNQFISLNGSIQNAKLRRRLFGESMVPNIPPEQEKNHDLALKALGLISKSSHTPAIEVLANETKDNVDPFPYDSDDERRVMERYASGRKHVRAEDEENELYAEDIETPRKNNVHCENQVAGATSRAGLPFVSRRESAILVVGISGFTKLSTVLDLDNLAEAIKDSSFDLIVNDIRAHGGDVLKFAGDAILVEWSTLHSNPVPVDDMHSFVPSSLGDCGLAAATCAAKLVSEHSNVHCGLGVGEVVGIHVGASQSLRKHIALGDALDQVSKASRSAKLGEVVSSPEALKVLSAVCDFDQELISVVSDQPQVIVRQKVSLWGNIQVELKRTETIGEESLKKVVRKLPLKYLERYRDLLTLYTHPVIVADDEAIYKDRAVKNGVPERIREHGEICSVYVLCIAPTIPVRVSGDEELDRRLFVLLNDVMNLTTRQLLKCGGHLRQFIVDDKGPVIIATLGLRGSAEPNMIAEVALPATISFHNALQNELGLQSKVGATLGEAYCGYVGGSGRREYAVMGSSVNLAARLMSSPTNPGILVSKEVQALADMSYAFNALCPVKAKGFSEPVSVFEPLGPLERNWGRLVPNLIGRETEIGEMVQTAKEMSNCDCATRIFVIRGDTGMGKSSTAVHALESIHTMIGTTQGRLLSSKVICCEADRLVPFGAFSKILLDALEFYHEGFAGEIRARRTVNSFGSLDLYSFTDKVASDEISDGIKHFKHASRLCSICREMNAPPEFYELFCEHLLGFDLLAGAGSEKGQWTTRSHTNLIDFLVRLFLRCVTDCGLAVLVLDDVHNMDVLSSLVLQHLFDRGRSLLIICTSNTASPSSVEETFWDSFKSDQTDGRFKVKTLKPFTVDDTMHLVTNLLGLQLAGDVPELSRNIMTRSLGCPHIACAIIESIKHGLPASMIDIPGIGENNEATFCPLENLFDYRIGSLEVSVQEILTIGAVLGVSFGLPDIVFFLRHTARDEDDMRKRFQQTVAALESAVQKGILFVSEEICEDEENVQDHAYSSFASKLSAHTNKRNSQLRHCVRCSFSNPLWRSTIIDELSDSRRREVHRNIAISSIQSGLKDGASDFMSQTRLFGHWKAGGNKEQATKVALCLANRYERVGLHNARKLLLEDALEMWACTEADDDGDDDDTQESFRDDSSKDAVASMTQEHLDALTVTDVECQIRLLVALGKALNSANTTRESLVAYQNALMIFSDARSAEDLEDRSIVFPVFRALLQAIKLGQIEQDEDWSFEQALIARFVQESCIHGDPIHYAPALALQTEIHVRIGKFHRAIFVQQGLSEVYKPSEHSAGIVEAYGTDKAAQCFARCASWYAQVKDTDAALAMCDHVSSHIMPAIERCDIHNSMTILYPLLWVLKDNGRALDAKRLFEKYVIDAFREYHSDGSLTPCMPIYEPILMLLNLSAGTATESDRRAYAAWALVEDNLRFCSELNASLGHAGRCPDSISSEICMLLARNNPNAEEASTLTLMGLAIAMETQALTEEKRMIVARTQVMPVYQSLISMATVQDNTSSDPLPAGEHNLIFI